MNVVFGASEVANRPSLDPFGPDFAPVAPSVQRAFDQVMQQIELGAGAAAVIGAPGTGKTHLLSLVEDACLRRGLLARRVHRGDLVNSVLSEPSDVLLIDEAECIDQQILETLTRGKTKIAAFTVFACAKDRDNRFSKAQARLVPISRLSDQEAANYIRRAAISGDLFSHDALNLLVGAAGGSIRMLRMLAGMALFCAGRDGSSQVGSRHVTEAFASRIIGPSDNEAADLSLALNVHYSDVPLDRGVDEWNALCVDKRINQWAATPTLMGVCLRTFFKFLAAPGLVTASTIGIVMFALGPAPQLLPKGALGNAAFAASPRSDAEAVPPAAEVQYAADVPRHSVRHAAFAQPFAPSSTGRIYAAAAVGHPLFPGRPQISTSVADARPVVSQTLRVALPVPPVELSAPAGAREIVEDLGASQRQLALDLAGSLRAAWLPATPDRNEANETRKQQSANSGAVVPTSFSISSVAGPVDADDTNAPRVSIAPQIAPADIPSHAGESAVSIAAASVSGASVSQTPVAVLTALAPPQPILETVEQAQAAKETADQAEAAKDVAALAKGAKDSADQTKVAKDSADQAKAVKETADLAKGAKDTADQTKAVKEVTDLAKGTKDAADQVKAAKEVVDAAKAIKDAADQAKAAKDAADTAKAAKDAADQAKAAKEAADTAKAAKDAADQAKAAKDAADTAKAAKDAADQANAAKEAVDAAKAAKDAADQAKAAKDAADTAKAAKDAADAAKAAKDAADAAKAAKDAADAAKIAADTAKAVKDVVDLAKLAHAH